MEIAAPRPAASKRWTPAQIAGGLYFLASYYIPFRVEGWRDALFRRWEAQAPGSFWAAHGRWPIPAHFAIMLAAVMLMARFKRWRWWIALYAPLMVAALWCGTARASYGILPDRLVIRSALPWRADRIVPFTALTLTRRLCYPLTNKYGDVINDAVDLDAAWREGGRVRTFDLAEGTDDRMDRWLEVTAPLTALIHSPAETLTYRLSEGDRSGPACLAHFAERLDTKHMAMLRALVG